MKAIREISSPAAFLPINNIDTDQIIPARFLKTTTKDGFGEKLFYDWRYLSDGQENPDFVLNRAPGRGAQILFAGENFGCGSSREHAPWAIQGYGIDAVIALSFADIFRNNAQKIGLLLIALPELEHQALQDAIAANPEERLMIDLPAQCVTFNGKAYAFEIDPYAKQCLVEGLDPLGYLLSKRDAIRAYERKRNSEES